MSMSGTLHFPPRLSLLAGDLMRVDVTSGSAGVLSMISGGYGGSAKVTSGDDTLLLHRIQAVSGKGVASQLSSGTHVYTDSPGTWGAPAASAGHVICLPAGISTRSLIAMGVPFYLMHMLLLSGALMGVIEPVIWGPVLALFMVKCLADYFLYYRIGTITGLGTVTSVFPVMEALMVLYFAVVPLLGLIVPVRWKEKY